MRIEKLAGNAPANHAQIVRTATGADPREPVSPVRRVDRVHISDHGRALAQLSGALVRDPGAALTPEQIAELRLRVASGFYDSPQMIDAIAHRILGSGDLDSPSPTPHQDSDP